ncbi:TPA: Flp pilus assembly complex ATPase component TadA [Aeromonas veronii]|nr:Flp pilus assembly complex ATPase component TadA [Aeromonas veronii]
MNAESKTNIRDEDKFVFKMSGSLDVEKFRMMLRQCNSVGTYADIYFAEGDETIIRSLGYNYSLIKRAMQENEMRVIGTELGKDASAISSVLSGTPMDGSYSMLTNEGDIDSAPLRWRFNMTPYITPSDKKGVQITMRRIEYVPPPIEKMNLECGIIDNIKPRNGVVIISGETGSGKSTLIASVLRWLKETPNGNYVINTYESPVEFLHNSYPCDPTNKIYQTEINPYGWLKTFAEGVRSSLRRNPNGFLVGECRDLETMEATIRASSSGHFVYTTTHANSVSDTITRFINEFPEQERHARYYELISNLRLIVSQYLATTVSGGKTPVREYLVFTPSVRNMLKSTSYKDAEQVIRSFIKENGGVNSPIAQSTEQSASNLFNLGTIDEAEYKYIMTGV